MVRRGREKSIGEDAQNAGVLLIEEVDWGEEKPPEEERGNELGTLSGTGEKNERK